MTAWYVYILRCADQSLYTGVTTDPERRLKEHNHDKAGAKYTRARRPVKLIYQEIVTNRSAACRREHTIKALSRMAKEALINGYK